MDRFFNMGTAIRFSYHAPFTLGHATSLVGAVENAVSTVFTKGTKSPVLHRKYYGELRECDRCVRESMLAENFWGSPGKHIFQYGVRGNPFSFSPWSPKWMNVGIGTKGRREESLITAECMVEEYVAACMWSDRDVEFYAKERGYELPADDHCPPISFSKDEFARAEDLAVFDYVLHAFAELEREYNETHGEGEFGDQYWQFNKTAIAYIFASLRSVLPVTGCGLYTQYAVSGSGDYMPIQEPFASLAGFTLDV